MDTHTLYRFPSIPFSLFILLALLFGACSSGERNETADALSPDASSEKTEMVAVTSSGTDEEEAFVTPMLSEGPVTTPKIFDGAVTNAKIADHAVTSPRSAPVAPNITYLDVTSARIDGTSISIQDDESVKTEDIPDAANWVSLGSTVVDGTTSTYTPPSTQGTSNDRTTGYDALTLTYSQGVATPGEYSLEPTKTETDAVIVSGILPLSPAISAANPQQQNTKEIIPDAQQIPKPEPIRENGFRAPSSSPYSTFSIDVDNASYSNVRGYLTRGTLPPAEAVRIEELVNYFDYNYPDPTGKHPFAFHTEVVECPWNSDHLIVRLALQGERIQPEQAIACNLVFLMDVSGSMGEPDKLPLLKESFLKLVDHLRPQDRVAIVVYAGAAGLVLESTPGSDREKIKEAIKRLEAGGSTAGGAGIQLAYKIARDNFLPDGVNRVILATDGDFNVGVHSDEGLVSLIEEKRKDGVFLSVLGFGTGNYQDAKMEKLADNGNGNYYYVDKLAEGERVLVDEMSGTLHAIAKDVKLQIKFNPAKVAAYRLIGYENRVLAAKDFENDAKDAGELGAGHRVTALYEVVPAGAEIGFDLDTTKGEEYQIDEKRPELLSSHDLLLARLRYKEPKDSVSKLIEHLVKDERKEIESASEGTRFALAVAEWGMILRGSGYVGSSSFDDVLSLAKRAADHDPEGYRQEFIELVEKARGLTAARGTVGTR